MLGSTPANKEVELAQVTTRLSALSTAHNLQLSSHESSLAKITLELATAVETVQQLTLEQSTQEAALVQAVEDQERLLVALDASEATVVVLEQTLTQASAANAVLEGMHADNLQSSETTSHLQKQLDDTTNALLVANTKVVELEAVVQDFTARPVRSFDDVEVESVRAELESVKGIAAALHLEIEELTSLEWGAKEARKDADEKIVTLLQEQATLQFRISELANNEVASEIELVNVRGSLVVVEARTAEIEERLAEESIALQRLEQVNTDLEAKVADMDLLSQQVALLQDRLVTLATTLETTQLSAEEAGFTALQESITLQDRLSERDSSLTAFRLELECLGELRTKLAVAQDSRAAVEDLSRKQQEEAIAMSSKISALQAQLRESSAMNASFKHLLGEVNLHVAELETTISTLGSSLALASQPVPTVVPTVSPDAIILVQRLRDERDTLVAQLDFAQTESRFRHEALSTELGALQDLLAEEKAKSAALLTAEVQARSTSEEVAHAELEGLRAQVEVAAEELSRRSAQVEEANAKLFDFAHDAEELAVEFDHLNARSDSLQAELETSSLNAEDVSCSSSRCVLCAFKLTG